MVKESTKPKKHAKHAKTEKYVQKRLTSKEFKLALTNMLAAGVQDLLRKKVCEVIHAETVKKIIKEFDLSLIDQKIVVQLVKNEEKIMDDYFKKKNQSLYDIFDKTVHKNIESLLKEKFEFSDNTIEFVGKVVRSEFITSLFTNVIHTTLVSFYKKVNPIFGGITTRLLENKIRAFIEVIIKIILEQVVDFVVSPANQEIFSDFSRLVIRLLLKEKMANYYEELSTAQKKKVETLVESIVVSPKVQKLMREITAKVFDDVYKTVKNQKLEKFLKLGGKEKWLAEILVELSRPLLSQKVAVQFLAREIELATRNTSSPL